MPEFKNPQQEPGMDRRLLLVFALTFLVIVLSQPLLKKYLPQPSTPPAQTQSQPPVQTPAPTEATPPQRSAPSSPAISKQASAENETVIESDLYKITFTNRGGQVKSWILKNFKDDKGHPLDMVNTMAAEKFGYPLSLWTYDETLRNKLNTALCVAAGGPGTVLRIGESHVSAPAEITFDYADQDVTVHKAFSFDHTYVVKVETSVVSKGSTIAALPAWPSGFGDEVTLAGYAASRIEYQYDNNIERLAVKKVIGGNTLQGPFDWIGATDQYFAAAFIPENPQSSSAVTLHSQMEIPKDPQKPQETAKTDVLGIAAGNLKAPTVARLYVGPKELHALEAVSIPTIREKDPDLRALVNFGFWGIIARPLFIWLRWTHDHIIANWGWSIVIQTLIINLVLLPLRISSMKSALKMQKVQPQMNVIKEKYKKYSMRDPRRQEMNTEIGELMKREGVSPAGGCLPMLIQMPFLFAYYGMLGAALDLRQAHWLWISDLSSRDPYYLLPILIIITGLATQRMTPQAGMDPSQQKMMNIMMPLMFGFISFNLAAGLCLYWCETSLIAIVQQMIMNKTSLGREMRELALKRARKKEKK